MSLYKLKKTLISLAEIRVFLSLFIQQVFFNFTATRRLQTFNLEAQFLNLLADKLIL